MKITLCILKFTSITAYIKKLQEISNEIQFHIYYETSITEYMETTLINTSMFIIMTLESPYKIYILTTKITKPTSLLSSNPTLFPNYPNTWLVMKVLNTRKQMGPPIQHTCLKWLHFHACYSTLFEICALNSFVPSWLWEHNARQSATTNGALPIQLWLPPLSKYEPCDHVDNNLYFWMLP